MKWYEEGINALNGTSYHQKLSGELFPQVAGVSEAMKERIHYVAKISDKNKARVAIIPSHGLIDVLNNHMKLTYLFIGDDVISLKVSKGA